MSVPQSTIEAMENMWVALLRDQAAVCTLVRADEAPETEHVPITWEDGEPFALFDGLAAGLYNRCRVFSASGELLAYFSIGRPIAAFPEWLIPFDIPEGGSLFQPLRCGFKGVDQ